MESETTQEVSVPVLLPNPVSWALESGPRFLKGRLALLNPELKILFHFL